MASVFGRDSPLGTVVGIVVVVVAIIGSVFFGWSWNNPDSFVVILIGAGAAVAAGWVTLQKLRG